MFFSLLFGLVVFFNNILFTLKKLHVLTTKYFFEFNDCFHIIDGKKSRHHSKRNELKIHYEKIGNQFFFENDRSQ